MGVFTFGCLKINGPINFVLNYQDFGPLTALNKMAYKNWGSPHNFLLW